MAETLVYQLAEEMKRRKIKTPKLSNILNIPKDRIYKWFQEGTNPKEEDAVKIRKWLCGEMENVPRETAEIETHENDGSGLYKRTLPQNDDYKDKYIKLLEQQNAFLQKTIETNLTDISLNQTILMAQLKGQIKREAQRFVKEDPVKANSELDRVNKLVGEYLGSSVEKGIVVGS